MTYITWIEEYSVGHELIDQQHHKLVDLINILHQAIIDNKIEAGIKKILDELLAYTKYHFDAEEKLMQAYRLDGYEEHVQFHVDLIEKIDIFNKRIFSKENINVIEMMGFLRQWLLDHITVEDKKMLVQLPNRELTTVKRL